VIDDSKELESIRSTDNPPDIIVSRPFCNNYTNV
jgi:hypothetical protein